MMLNLSWTLIPEAGAGIRVVVAELKSEGELGYVGCRVSPIP